MKPQGFIKENTLRPAILEFLKYQTPLHLSAIHARLETVMDKKLKRSSVSGELAKMVNDGVLRRAAFGVYEKKKLSGD